MFCENSKKNHSSKGIYVFIKQLGLFYLKLQEFY